MSVEEKEMGEAMIKNMFAQIPIVGWALNETIFDRRSRVKQKRLNVFTNLMIESMNKRLGYEIDLENIKSDQFGDLFESVLKRVMETSNEDKLKRFRDILVGQIVSPNKEEFTETFLDITGRLKEIQIHILKTYCEKRSKVSEAKEYIYKVEKDLDTAKQELNLLKRRAENGQIQTDESIAKIERTIRNLEVVIKNEKDKLIELKSYKLGLYYELEEGEFAFYLQDLVSKSLLKEVLTPEFGGTEQSNEPTEFGFRYIAFLLS